MKRCRKCGISKALTEFQKRATGRDGYQARCKVCYTAAERERQTRLYRSQQTTYTREYKKAKKKILYAEAIKRQQGRCAICGQHESVTGRLVSDHCHNTNRVREMLCNSCNLGLGHFHDNPDRMIAAAAYVIRHST